MIKIGVEVKGLDALTKTLSGMPKQIRYATAVALTRTAHDVKGATQKAMESRLDRPTAWAQRGIVVQRATPQTLQSRIELKPGKFAQAEMLFQQFTSGARLPKRFEVRLQQVGLIKRGEFVVPGSGAKIDRFGNVLRSQLSAILEAIKAVTPAQTKRKRRNVPKGRIFWADGSTHLARGAWLELPNKQGIRALLIVVNGTAYRRRLDLEQIGRRVVRDRFGLNYAAAFQQAMAGAR